MKDSNKFSKIIDQLHNKNLRRKTPFPQLAKFGLLGFYSDAKTITLDKDHVIKKVTIKERNDFYKRSGLKDNKKIYSKYDYMFYCYYEEKFDHGLKIIEKQKKVFLFFKVFKDKSIGLPYCNRYVKIPEDNVYRSIGFISVPKDYFYEQDPYVVSKSDTYEFKKIWKNYSKIYQETNRALLIAMNRYYYAFQRNNFEDKIIDLMIAFEALYLTETGELSFRLALRVSKFLEDYYNKGYIYVFIKKSYNLRSKIVHGGDLKTKDFKILGKQLTKEQVVYQLTEIFRLSLIEYVKNYNSLNVSQLIKSIDNLIVEEM